MFKYATPLLATGALLLSGSALAKPGSPSEERGFKACKHQIERTQPQLGRVAFSRTYYLNNTDEGRQYYINLSAWENGDRVQKRSDCETTRSGRRVLAVTTEDGSYRGVLRGRVTVDVATR